MTAFREIVFAPLGYGLRIVLLLLTLSSFYLCVMAFARRRAPGYRIFTLLHAAGLLALLMLVTDGTYFPVHLPERVSFPAAVEAVYALPWAALAASALCSAAAQAVCFFSDARFAKKRPSPDSVKEALDDLPVGVCFIAENGTVTLSNLKMNEWCHQLTRQPLADGNAFLRELEASGERRGEQLLLRLSESCVLLFTQSQIEANGKRYRQLTAADMTEQYRVTAFLEERNAKLRDLTLRMKAYSVEQTELVMRRESLAARVAVHDGLGHALLRTKQYLEHPDPAEAAALYRLLRETNDHLGAAASAGEEQQTDPLEHALHLAKSIGVNVTVTGDLPRDAAGRRISGQAIRECAMNAVKHAGGDEMRVSFSDTPEALTVTLITNGAPAAGPVPLRGGLRSLNDAAFAAGGSMDVRPSPVFTVTLRLPKK
jgi:signal transduction histidine kinase